MTCLFAAALILGMLVRQTGSPLAGVCAAVLAGIALFSQLAQRRWRESMLRGALFLTAGMLGAGAWAHSEQVWQQEQAQMLYGQEVLVRGTLLKKEEKANSWQLTLKLAGFQNQIIVSAEDGDYPLDCVLSVKGSVKEFQQPRNEGQFHQFKYFKCKRVLAQMFAEEIRCLARPTGVRAWREGLFVLRSRMCAVYEAYLPEREAGILSAMTTGEKIGLDAAVRTLFQHAGISHILAISGMHISLIGRGCYRLLRRCRRSYLCSGLLAGGCLLLYAELIGSGVSARRAVGMFLVYLAAQAVGRGYDLYTSVAVLASSLLLENPFLLEDASFQFSFLAVTAVAAAQQFFPKLPQGSRWMKLLQSLCLSVCMQLVTMPLVAYQYYELPLYALAVNLLLLPYAGLLVGCGLLGGLAGVWAPPLGACLLFPCKVVLTVYVWVCTRVDALPGAVWICGKPSVQKLCVYYGSLLTAVLVLEWMQHRMQCAWLANVQRQGKNKEKLALLRLRQFQCSAAGMALLTVWLCVCLLHPPAGERGFELDYLDVGQGDCAMVRTADGVVCMIDGGSSDVSGVGTYRILPFLKAKGIRRVDVWVLSHLDEDHVSGFYEVLESGYPVGTVFVSAQLPENEASAQLRRVLSEKQITLRSAEAGQYLALDKAGKAKQRARLCFLAPAATTPYADVNGASLVCLYDDGSTRALFTGDIGVEQEEWLLAQQVLGHVDVYKSAHHGSKYSNSEAFLQALTPELSVISCAEKNRYGHPAAEAVEHLSAHSAHLLYTMESGQIQVRRVDKFRQRKYNKNNLVFLSYVK